MRSAPTARKCGDGMGRVKCIFLDLDNTLYPYEPCNRAGLAAVFARLAGKYNMSAPEVKSLFFRSRAAVKKRAGKAASSHSRLLYFKELIGMVGGRTDCAESLHCERLFWRKYFERMKLFAGVRGFVSRARELGLVVCIVTNLTAQVQLQKIVRLGLGSMVDYVVTSEEAGFEKPDANFFSHAVGVVGCRPDEAVMLGDSEEEDVSGARRAGLAARAAGEEFFSGRECLEFLDSLVG